VIPFYFSFCTFATNRNLKLVTRGVSFVTQCVFFVMRRVFIMTRRVIIFKKVFEHHRKKSLICSFFDAQLLLRLLVRRSKKVLKKEK